MRYLPHIVLVYVAIGLQRGLDMALRYSETRLDLPVIAAMYVCACLPRATGPLAAAVAGLAYDLSGAGPVGVHAFCFAVGALLTARMSAASAPRLFGAIMAGVVVALTLRCALYAVRGNFVGDVRPYFWGWPATVMLTGVATAVASPLLFRWRRPFLIFDRRY